MPESRPESKTKFNVAVGFIGSICDGSKFTLDVIYEYAVKICNSLQDFNEDELEALSDKCETALSILKVRLKKVKPASNEQSEIIYCRDQIRTILINTLSVVNNIRDLSTYETTLLGKALSASVGLRLDVSSKEAVEKQVDLLLSSFHHLRMVWEQAQTENELRSELLGDMRKILLKFLQVDPVLLPPGQQHSLLNIIEFMILHLLPATKQEDINAGIKGVGIVLEVLESKRAADETVRIRYQDFLSHAKYFCAEARNWAKENKLADPMLRQEISEIAQAVNEA